MTCEMKRDSPDEHAGMRIDALANLQHLEMTSASSHLLHPMALSHAHASPCKTTPQNQTLDITRRLGTKTSEDVGTSPEV